VRGLMPRYMVQAISTAPATLKMFLNQPAAAAIFTCI